MEILRKYGVATHIYLPIIKRAVVDFAVGADWTPAAGDVKISKDGAAAANVTNLPTAITMGNTAMWDFSMTATEMQAAKVMVSVADSATKAVEDQMFIIGTYGNASAEHAVDLDDSVRAGLTALPNAAAEAAGGLFTRGSGAGQINQPANGRIDVNTIAVSGTTQTAGDIMADTNDIQTRLPAALVSGRMDVSVGAMAANVITATAINADAITDAKVAADVTIASVTGSVGSVTGAVGSVTGNVGGNVTGSVGSVVGLTAANLDTTISSRASAANLSTVAGYIDTEIADIQGRLPAALVGGKMDSTLDAAERAAIADKLLGRSIAGGADGGRTVTSALRTIRNRSAIAAGTLTVYQEDDATPDHTAAVTTAAGNPIVEVDPA